MFGILMAFMAQRPNNNGHTETKTVPEVYHLVPPCAFLFHFWHTKNKCCIIKAKGGTMAKRRKQRTALENRIITNKIARLEREGLKPKQAIAAAFRMYREGELNIPTQTKKSQQNTLGAAIKLAALLGARRTRRPKKK